MKSHLVQCLACQKVKNTKGLWEHRDVDMRVHDISHTYCSDCYTVLQNSFFAARDFKTWDFDKQVKFLAKELDARSQKYDRERFKLYLEEFFCVSEADFEKFYEALKTRLYQSVCLVCHEEILAEEEPHPFGRHQLHRRCHKEIHKKISILLENDWDKTGKLDAYFDLLRLEKSLRPAVRAFLEGTRGTARKHSTLVA